MEYTAGRECLFCSPSSYGKQEQTNLKSRLKGQSCGCVRRKEPQGLFLGDIGVRIQNDIFLLSTSSFPRPGLFRSHVVLLLFKPAELIRGCDNLTYNSLFICLFKYSCCVWLPSPVPEALVLAEVQKQCLDSVPIFGRGIPLLPVTPRA